MVKHKITCNHFPSSLVDFATVPVSLLKNSSKENHDFYDMIHITEWMYFSLSFFFATELGTFDAHLSSYQSLKAGLKVVNAAVVELGHLVQ